ncbi:MAG TPA: hypothetical protein VMC42_09280 [Methanoregulaceae archaeon]|nr:hypothetical protein [Methanoregulaceae archaeon]
MTTTRSLILAAVICGFIFSCSFASAVTVAGTGQVSQADLIRGQAGDANSVDFPYHPVLHILQQQQAVIRSGWVANNSGFHFTLYDTGTSIFQNLTRWQTPLIAPWAPPAGTGFSATGTVTWLPMEGGFFGIVSDDGKQYDPLNLPKEYAQDGMRVRFTAKTDPDMASFHMWGTIVSIIDMYPISRDGRAGQGVFVHYERSGGIAGFDDKLTIYENRTAIVNTRNGGRTFTITPSEKAGLVSLFGSTGFDLVNQEDLPMFKIGAGADLFSYVIEFRGHKIQAIELAIPDSLRPVIDSLDEIVRKEE